MTSKRKLTVGPLPEQPVDPGSYEETEVLWGRVIFVVLVLCALLAGLLSMFLGQKPGDQGVATPEQTFSAAPLVKSATEIRQVLAEPEQQAEQVSASVSKEDEPRSQAPEDLAAAELPAKSSEETVESAPDGADIPPSPALAEVISPVSIFHMGIAHAELTHVVTDGKPAEPLGYNIAMSEQGIIKVILYTEMQGLQKSVLYHDWYLGDKRQARVRIPVNVAQQNSYSSKFINHQMLGDWSVKIVDEQGELYAQASFTVQ
ncbi:MAG: hypothetical protein C9356_06665 [Oleiphilus sp.]|nr:MAG: hypothetical protein C9356_06665 [Oleiphilus sp.]